MRQISVYTTTVNGKPLTETASSDVCAVNCSGLTFAGGSKRLKGNELTRIGPLIRLSLVNRCFVSYVYISVPLILYSLFHIGPLFLNCS